MAEGMMVRDPRPFALAYEGCSYGYAFRAWRENQTNIAAKRKQCPGMVKYIPVHSKPGAVLLDCIGLVCAAYSVPVADGRPMGASDSGMMYYPAKNGISGNGFMDNINAETARRTWGSKPISSIPEPTPETPGIIVFTDPSSSGIGHIGIYLGTDYKNPVTGKVYKGKCAAEATTSGTGRVQVFRLGARGGSGSRQWKYWAYAPKNWAEWADKYWGAYAPAKPEKPAQGPAEATGGLKTGDRVRIKRYGVPYHPGGKAIPDADWLRNTVHVIREIDESGKGKGGKPVALLRGADGGLGINSWCAVENLTKA